MTLSKNYLEYPHRNHGMDHTLYPWSNLFNRKPVVWPDSKPVALWITVGLEYFPLTPNDGPFRAPGHMVTPFPDYRTFTARDYGNRIGVFRIMKVLQEFGLTASAPMSTALISHAPALVDAVQKCGWEIVGHGIDMNRIHYGGMDKADETRNIEEALAQLNKLTGHAPSGWFSPGRSESENTLELLTAAGLSYVCDWVNDDMPYIITTDAGEITAMPHTMELEDRHLMVSLGQNEATYREQILSAFDLLRREGDTYGGRILHLNLTPYIIGQPFRIHILREVLTALMDSGAIWNATGAGILDCWKKQQG